MSERDTPNVAAPAERPSISIRKNGGVPTPRSSARPTLKRAARPPTNGSPDTPEDPLERLRAVEAPEPLKEPAAPGSLEHRQLQEGPFWQRIPAFADVTEEEFLEMRFQNRNSVTSIDQLVDTVGPLLESSFVDDVREGMRQAPMLMRLSPYLLSLVDWDDPYADPIRKQFIPIASARYDDHPMLQFDSLAEQDDSPVPGLVHRYEDKVLFLALDVCPVYCRFCTRSYAIGGDTDSVAKVDYKPIPAQWDRAFAYLLSRPEIEDVVISGGDAYFLPPNRLRHIGETLLAIPHIRRIRFATKGPAVMPMRILTDEAWTGALVDVTRRGRSLGKEVCLHTHFNHPTEITGITRQAMDRLFEAGVKVRNQSVLIRGVNDDPHTMRLLVKRLSYVNVQPYYVYQHDMVKGVEDLRTTVAQTVELERTVRGVTAGFNTPVFVTDAPGGGGKRDVHSYEYYDEVTGISVYRSPSVDEDRVHLYFDPIHLLSEEGQIRWADPSQHGAMMDEALDAAGCRRLTVAN